jgi:hypothetical protein
VLLDITEVGESLGKLHTSNGNSDLMGVLELMIDIPSVVYCRNRILLVLNYVYLREHGGKSLLTKQLIYLKKNQLLKVDSVITAEKLTLGGVGGCSSVSHHGNDL